MAGTFLTRTVGAGNRKTWTWSSWIKRSKVGELQNVWGVYVHANDNFRLFFTAGDALEFKFYNGTSYKVETTRLFRDTSAWYHIVCTADTTNSTQADRLRLYVNGERQSGGGTQPTQNLSMSVNDSNNFEIGRYNSGGYFDGSMSHINFVDGTALDASAFGSTDSTTGEWKIKTSPSVTYGTNGYFILKDGNSVTDQSGNSNNFTVDGDILSKTEDCPSNVFATGNSLIKGTNGNSNGNNTSTSGQNSWETLFGTLGMATGKYYAEFKMISNNVECGIVDIEQAQTFDIYPGSLSRGFGYRANGDVYKGGSGQSGTFASYTAGDIIGVAVDMTNNKLYLSKNGTWQNSGDPTSGASGTGALSIDSGYTYTFAFGAYNGSVSANFGNGYFGTTAVSSAGTNASNNGIFEYDVPSGYTALSTKGLNL